MHGLHACHSASNSMGKQWGNRHSRGTMCETSLEVSSVLRRQGGKAAFGRQRGAIALLDPLKSWQRCAQFAASFLHGDGSNRQPHKESKKCVSTGPEFHANCGRLWQAEDVHCSIAMISSMEMPGYVDFVVICCDP